MSVNFNLNGKSVTAQAEPDTPLLWVIRDELGLTGTKFGCGQALCGACTVHLNGAPVRSCQTALSAVQGQKVSTIESLPRDNSHPLQVAWIKHDEQEPDGCRHRRRHEREHLPLRHLSAHPRRHQGRRRRDARLSPSTSSGRTETS
jgi:hypothetical protein